MSAAAIAEKLDELSKHELVQQLARAKSHVENFNKKHKGTIKRVTTVVACGAVAATTGVAAGLLELKAPLIPKTKFRWDIAASSLLGLINLSGVTEELQPFVQSASDSLSGHGWGRMAEKFGEKQGIKRTARTT